MNAAAIDTTGFAALTIAKQCNCLLDVLRTELNEADVSQREVELIGLVADLGAQLYRIFWETPGNSGAFWDAVDSSEIAGDAGKLMGITRAMRHAAQSAPNDDVGWLQYAAADFAGVLVQQIERAIEGNEPPRPRVEVGVRNSGAAASQVARLVGSSMDRHGSSLEAA